MPDAGTRSWLVSLDRQCGAMQARASRLLGAVERAEVAAYASHADRQLACLSRAAGRWAATRLLAGRVPPEAWAFQRAAHGARLLHAPDGGVVHVAIADNANALLVHADTRAGTGVDIEAWRADAGWVPIVERFFAPQEQEALRSLPPASAAAAFTLSWTGKEALAKAQGVPLIDVLAVPLARRCPIDLRCWLARGMACAEWRIRWSIRGTDVLAFCGPPGQRFAEPCNISLQGLAAESHVATSTTA